MKIFNIFLLAVLSMFGLFFIYGFGFKYNCSESLPNTLYLSTSSNNISKGDIVDFKLEHSSVTFIKVVGGIPGDFIQVDKDEIFINEEKIGKALNNLNPIEQGVIPENFYFMVGEHPESFDSRYNEFGLVPKNALREKLCPIF